MDWKIVRQRFAFTVSATIAAFCLLLSTPVQAEAHKARSSDRPRIESAEARRLQRLALSIARSPRIARVKSELAQRMRQDPQAATPDGAGRLDSALDEIVLSFVTQAITSDVHHPHLLWWNNPPYAWKGRQEPGQRFALDNPDNINQIASLDPAASYVIRGKRRGSGPSQLTFVIYQQYLINSRDAKMMAGEEVSLVNPQVEADGTFTVTIGPEAANGRGNHIRNTTDGRFLLIRQTLSDWARQDPDVLEIRRVPASNVRPKSREDHIREAEALLRRGGPYWLAFQNNVIFRRPPNALPQPLVRPGNWGLVSMGNFHIAPDEALIVSVDPLGAGYLAIEACDPWMRSLESIHQSGSLNNAQAQPDPDGSLTYVVSASDPGVPNWLDTDGLSTGALFLRWQALGAIPPANAQPIRQVRLVKLTGLAASLPAGTPRVSPEERRALLSARAAAWGRRLAP